MDVETKQFAWEGFSYQQDPTWAFPVPCDMLVQSQCNTVLSRIFSIINPSSMFHSSALDSPRLLLRSRASARGLELCGSCGSSKAPGETRETTRGESRRVLETTESDRVASRVASRDGGQNDPGPVVFRFHVGLFQGVNMEGFGVRECR